MYKVIGADGKEYGPVTAEQLRQWMQEGRVNNQTMVQSEGAMDWKALGSFPEFSAPPVAGGGEAPPHRLTQFPVAVVILLHFLTCGIFTFIWLNLMHGKLPRVRANDPSAGKAVGFCFIPFFNLYWIFFTYRRLCLRVDEQRELYGLPPSNLRELATTHCIFQIIPYLNILLGYTIITPIFLGMMQSSINQLAAASAGTAPRRTLPATTVPAPGLSGPAVVAIVLACLIPFFGFFAALAIPGFVKARKQSQARRVINDARRLDAAIDQWAIEKGKRDGDAINTTEAAAYLRDGWKSVDILGNPYEISVVGPNQIRISPTTKTALNGVGVDWGNF